MERTADRSAVLIAPSEAPDTTRYGLGGDGGGLVSVDSTPFVIPYIVPEAWGAYTVAWREVAA